MQLMGGFLGRTMALKESCRVVYVHINMNYMISNCYLNCRSISGWLYKIIDSKFKPL
jgi:hypothetical protein